MTDWLGPRGRNGGIDTIPLATIDGALSLCGKHAIGPDRAGAMAQCGATTVVCLVEAFELADRYPEYLAWLHANAGTAAVWFPIHDLHAPGVAATEPLITELVRRLDRGEHLLMHCAAGIGRTGTIAVCLLIELGMTKAEALAHVAAHRPMAGPEVGAQMRLVEAWATRRSPGETGVPGNDGEVR